MTTRSNVQIQKSLLWLLDMGVWRYKVLYGGRGGMKSHTIARCLITLASQKPLRILGARETMKSLADSVHHLIASLIRELGIPGWTIEQARIYHANGSEFIFAGLRHNVSNIKSLEAVDIVWVEEAQSVSKGSWDVLIPTVRKANSEIWVSFNPELDTDDTYKRFVVSPPPRSRVQMVSYLDNPWCPAVLLEEAEHLRATDPRSYDHIWGGACRSSVEGAIYEGELARAEAEGRICRVEYDPAAPVHTYWDIGWHDTTTCWMIQDIAREIRVIDYHQSKQKTIADDLRMLQGRGYTWGTDYLPWDGGAKAKQTGKSLAQIMAGMGRRVAVVPQAEVHVGIQAVRIQFPRMWFDADGCADGIQGLRHYRYAPPASTGQVRREPVHDWASHPADGLRTRGMAATPSSKMPKPVTLQEQYRAYGPGHYSGVGRGGWS